MAGFGKGQPAQRAPVEVECVKRVRIARELSVDALRDPCGAAVPIPAVEALRDGEIQGFPSLRKAVRGGKQGRKVRRFDR